MDERIVQFRVGVMVLATIIITGMLVMLFGKFPSLSTGNFTVQMRFDEAPGVAQDTPIRKSGIFIGRVTDVSFDDSTDGVWITAQLSKPDKVYEHDIPRVGASLLGDAVIEFVRPEDIPKSTEKIQNGKRYEDGIVTPQPLERLSGIENRLATAASSIEKASKQWTKVGERVNTLLADNQDQLKRMLDSTEATLSNFDRTMDNTNKLLGDKQMQADLKKAAAELPKTIEDSRRAIASVEMSMAAMQKTVEAADRNLKNLEGFTQPLGEKGPLLVSRIEQGTEKLNVLITQLTRFTNNLNNPNGSLGQLLNNSELYDSLTAAVGNIEKLTRDLKPIVNDVRVFADKVARHPENLGVRGAIMGSSGIK